MVADWILPDFGSKLTSMNLPKRELLLFLKVFALPNASSRGFESRICPSILGNEAVPTFCSFE